MQKKLLATLLSVFISLSLSAQDTIRIMVNNILYYGQFTGFCTQSNNHPDNKDAYLRSILAHDLPDIFVVNEISSNPYYHQRIIDSVLAKISNRVYARASSENISGSNIMNMMYYNTAKLVLQSQHIMQSIVRDINLYTLYYKSPDLGNGDTAFIHCIGAHLKAGNSTSDEQSRRNQINNVLAWLQVNRQPGNYLIMGDFNVYTVEELAMQALLFNSDPDFRFYDPVNQLGHWNENSTFSAYHTQSTHTSGSCHSSGGLDDRFDFILASLDIIQGNKKVKYIEGSYRTMGQDGLHFNQALTDSPYNASAPLDVLFALYNNSDHLPVLLSLAIDQKPVESGIPFLTGPEFAYNNPVDDELTIHFGDVPPYIPFVLYVYSLHGRLLSLEKGTTGQNAVKVKLNHLPSGFYVAELNMMQYRISLKIIKH